MHQDTNQYAQTVFSPQWPLFERNQPSMSPQIFEYCSKKSYEFKKLIKRSMCSDMMINVSQTL